MPWMWHLESWGLGTGIHWSFRLLWLFLFCFALLHFVLPEVDFAEKLLLFLRRKRQPWELFLLGDSVQRLKSHSKSLRQVVPLEKLAASPEAQGSLWTQQETKREKQNSAVGSRLSEAGRWCRRLRELGASLHGVHLGRLPQPSPTDLHPLVQERQPLVALSVWQPQESTLFLPLWLGGGGVGGGTGRHPGQWQSSKAGTQGHGGIACVALTNSLLRRLWGLQYFLITQNRKCPKTERESITSYECSYCSSCASTSHFQPCWQRGISSKINVHGDCVISKRDYLS